MEELYLQAIEYPIHEQEINNNNQQGYDVDFEINYQLGEQDETFRY
jgi:hypothetical protein